MVNNLSQIQTMNKKPRTKSTAKKRIRSPTPKKTSACSLCRPRANNAPVIAHGLYRKHSWTHSHYYLQLLQNQTSQAQKDYSTAESQEEEYLGRYHKTVSRRQLMPKLKQVYGLHHQIPRLFQPGARQILEKCHHRKRLVEYFKIAKAMGVRVQSINFSSFLLSGAVGGGGCQDFSAVLDVSLAE